MPLLSITNLSKHFDGVKAVSDLSMGIEQGKITGIIGPNGSGKTTLVNLLSGMKRFDSGTVTIVGQHLSRINSPDLPLYGITRTFQDVRLFEQMTVLDNVLVVLTERPVLSALFAKHAGIHLQKAEEALKRVNLWDKRDERAASLSYGQRKLLEIARTLAMDTSIILFDEPFAGLFKEMVKSVADILRELRDHGKTIILIEHNMELIRQLSDYIFVMDGGQLLAEGLPNEVLQRRDVIEAYLGE